MNFLRPALVLLGLVAALGTAHAHPAAGTDAALHHGLLHPLTGVDHLLAMVAVGLWAAQLGGRARWILPATFFASVALGGFTGLAGIPLPGVEWVIVGSVAILGLALLLDRRAHPVLGPAMMALFGLVHGHAHGAELPAGASATAYAAGFLAATIALHLAGLGLGLAFLRLNRPNWLRLTGGGLLAGFAGLVVALA